MIETLYRWTIDRKYSLLGCLVCAVLLYLLIGPWLFAGGDPVLRMSAGPDMTRRHAIAVYLSRQAAAHRLSIELTNTAGSEECLQLVKSGQLDAAIVSSGVVIPDDDDIMVLGATQLEAVHVLVRKEMAEAGPLSETIRGKRVNIGERGSTEWLLAREFLSFARVRLPSPDHAGDVVLSELGKTELLKRAQALSTAEETRKESLLAELPDCLILLATMPSSVVQSLVEAADYRIMPLPATRAFLLDNMQDSSAQTTVIEREFLEPATIPTNSYFARRGFPEKDCETVGVRLLVVANKHVAAKAIRPLMKTMFEGEFSRRILPKSPRELATPYAIHPAAIAYLDRDKPLLIRDLMESFSTVLSIFGAFSAGALSLYGLLWRRKTRKPSDYYAEIRKLELLARNAQNDPTNPLQSHELAKYLDDRLLKLRQELIEDICEGRIESDNVIANILGLLTDSRQNLPRPERELSPAALPHPTPAPRPHIPLRRAA